MRRGRERVRPAKKDNLTEENKGRGKERTRWTRTRPRTRGPCSPSHSGPQTLRNAFLGSLSEALKSDLFGHINIDVRFATSKRLLAIRVIIIWTGDIIIIYV